MPRPNVLVLRGPGVNCNEETAHAFELAGADVTQLHLNRLLERPGLLGEFQVLCLPGGFSFGDDLGAGTVYAHTLRQRLGDELRRFRDGRRVILGICNGFQILLKTGLIVAPDPATHLPRASLALNAQGRFEDRWVRCQVDAGPCPFLPSGEVWELPVAHAEGRFVTAEPAYADALVSQGRAVFRYVDEAGGFAAAHPHNPNGAAGAVAGLCDDTGHVLALMPHPERHVSPYQHPRWTRRREQPEHGDGFRLFERLVGYFA